MIGCDCEVCKSSDPRDSRMRCSVLLEDENTKALIDTPPEFRLQAIRENLKTLDAVVITHAHADHIMGFDDLRRFCEMSGKTMPVYGTKEALERLTQIFYYAFDDSEKCKGYLRAVAHEITGKFQIGNIEFTPLPLPHGAWTSLGFVFSKNSEKRCAYLNDCKSVPDEILQQLENIPVLIIDGLRDKPHPTHMTVAEAIAVSQKTHAQKTYITHLTHEKLHIAREKELPKNCFLSYDGLELVL